MKSEKSWTPIKKNVIYENSFGYWLRDDDVLTPSGKKGKYMVFGGKPFVVLVATTNEKKVVFVRQFRFTVGKVFLELPAGSVEKGERPIEAAKRELLEETGATGDSFKELGEYWMGNGAIKMKAYVFLAKNVEFNGASIQEETEKITTELVDFDVALKKVMTGELNDERTMIGLLLAKNYLNL